MNHIKIALSALFFLLISSACFSVTFSGENIPFEGSFRLGLVDGPGAGVDIGADIYYPLEGINLGLDVDQQVTNSEYLQNLNILKYGLALKYNFSEFFFLTLHYGRASFYVEKALDYVDSLSGAEYSIDEDTHGSATYWGISPSFHVGEYYIMPRVVFNAIEEGGTISELDLLVGHKF